MNNGCVGCVTFIIFIVVFSLVMIATEPGSFNVGDEVEWKKSAYSYDEVKNQWNKQMWDVKLSGKIVSTSDTHCRVYVTELYQPRGIYSKEYGTESHQVSFYTNVAREDLRLQSKNGWYPASFGRYFLAIIVAGPSLWIISMMMQVFGKNGGNGGNGGDEAMGNQFGGFTPK